MSGLPQPALGGRDWTEAYEDAWRLRLGVMRAFVADGETHPSRLVHRFYAHERFHHIVADAAGAVRYAPYDHAKNSYKFPLLPTGTPAFRVVAVRDRYAIVPYYDNPADFLVDFLKDRAVDAVVELGSGYGRNLVELYYRGGPRGIPYYAGEVTESGTAMAALLAAQDPALRLIPFRFDHNNPDLSAVKERGTVLFFTVHSIEQVHFLRDDYFRFLAGHAGKAIGVHFEPFGFQLARLPGEVTDAQQRLFTTSKWNMNLVQVLRASAAQGEIEIAHLAKNVMDSGDPKNPTSLAVWTGTARRPATATPRGRSAPAGDWHNYYEVAWRLRRQVMDALIGQGETHPLRLVHRLYAHERFHRIVFGDDDSLRYGPSDHVENPHKFPMLPTGMPAFRLVAVRDRYEIVPFYGTPVDFLVDFLKVKAIDAVVELGSGYGRNLVELYYRGGPRGVPYYAGEVTESGTAIAGLLAGLDPEFRLIPFRFDHNNPDLSAVQQLGTVLFFTVHSIEAVPTLRDDYFRILAARAARVVGVHFEPFGFQLAQLPGEVDGAQRRLFAASGWNANLAQALQDSATRGEIDLAYLTKNVMDSGDPANPTSLAIWTNKKSA